VETGAPQQIQAGSRLCHDSDLPDDAGKEAGRRYHRAHEREILGSKSAA
jgi:hypothetical protein